MFGQVPFPLVSFPLEPFVPFPDGEGGRGKGGAVQGLKPHEDYR